MNRTIEDIQKDIELLGIKGGYDIEQLLTPQDCRRLSYEIERLNNIINEAKDYIKIKSIKFTMAYVEDDGRIDLSRSDYRIDKLTSKQVKELLEKLDKGEMK